MNLTVEDVYNFPELAGLKLIAGEKGLGREVSACGILDYEFDKDLGDKYRNYNYRVRDFMTLTSFLYAKDNEFLIMDAVRGLISKGGSGLIIKNVYGLTIRDNVIKYANNMGFPIFIMTDKNALFEDIILLIAKRAEHYRSLLYRESVVDKLLAADPQRDALILAREINVSFKNDIFAMYMEAAGRLDDRTYLDYESRLSKTHLIGASSSVFKYGRGIMVIFTEDMITSPICETADTLIRALGKEADMFVVGVSDTHHFLADLGKAISESLSAARLQCLTGPGRIMYPDIGIYKLLIPLSDTPQAADYSEKMLDLLRMHDAENGSKLLMTAESYVKAKGDIAASAEALGRHPNTIRNRLRKISDILGFDALSLDGYESLSIAIKIDICIHLPHHS